MTIDLFQIPPTPATPLQKARARLAKAEAELERRWSEYYNQGAEGWPSYQDGKRDLESAKDSVQVEENREIERLRAAREH